MSCSNNEEPTKSAEVLAKVTTSFYDTHKIEAAYPSNALNPYVYCYLQIKVKPLVLYQVCPIL